MGIHQLMVAMVLARRNLPIPDRVKRVFKAVCYEVSPGRIQQSEVQYIFHLVYNWIRVTTHLELKTSAVEEAVLKKLFPDKKNDTVQLEEASTQIGKFEELVVIFNIFTKDPRAQNPEFKVFHEMRNIKAFTMHDQSRQTMESGLDQRTSQQRLKASMANAMRDSVATAASRLGTQKMQGSADQQLSTANEESKKTLNLRHSGSKELSAFGRNSKDGAIEQGTDSNVNSPKSIKSNASNYAPNLRQPLRQLLWNAQVLTKLDDHCPRNTLPLAE